MFIKRYGKGERAFFALHGWSGDHTTFEPLEEFLPHDATIYSADLPGCGQSPQLPELNLEMLAGEIAAEIAKLDSRPVTLIGNCSGAVFLLATLRRIADRVDRLILIDPFAYAPWYFRIFVSTIIGRYAYFTTFANPVGRWITNLSLIRHRTAETDITRSFGDVDHEISYRYLQLLVEIESIEGFAWIRHPIDIIYGERTFGAVRKSIALWRGIWPHSSVIELEGAGHLPIQEATDRLSRIIFTDNP